MLWLPTGDGSYRLSEITADATASSRGGDLLANPAELWGDLKPWSDGSGDRLRWRLLLPEGVRVSRIEEGETGWKVFLSNGEEVWIDSLYPTRWLPYLSAFDRPGVKSIWWRDVSAIVDNGEGWWQAEQFEISGLGQHEFHYQDVDNSEDVYQPPWVPGSFAIYGPGHKVNNKVGGPQYQTGKVAHWPAPLAIFWDADGRFIGKVIGRLVKVGNVVEKQFPIAALAPFAQAARRVSTDATLGYTSIGASTTTAVCQYGTLGTMSEDGTVSSISIYHYTNGTSNVHLALYSGGWASKPLISGSPSGLLSPIGSTPQWVTHTYGSSFSISSGTDVGMATFRTSKTGNSQVTYHDAGTAADLALTYTQAQSSPPPDPLATGGWTSVGNVKKSMYLTYTTGGGGGGKPYYYYNSQQ